MGILSEKAKRVLEVALANRSVKAEVVSAFGSHAIAAAIVATSASATVDFADLIVGDLVIAIPALSGGSMFEVVVAPATKPSSAVIGSLYLVLRAL